MIDPISPSVIFFTFSLALINFDLASVFHFGLDMLIVIFIKFGPLFPDILPKKSLVATTYLPETMSFDDVPILPGLILDGKTFDVSIEPDDFLLH